MLRMKDRIPSISGSVIRYEFHCHFSGIFVVEVAMVIVGEIVVVEVALVVVIVVMVGEVGVVAAVILVDD